MSRSIEVKLGDHTYEMPITYAASRRFAEVVGDPLLLSMSTFSSGSLRITQEQVIDAIFTGVKEGGAKLTRDEVADLIFSGGVFEFYQKVGEYIGAMTAGEPKRKMPGSSDPPKKKP
jgi:hypothetical protein